ncbi:MAG: hypothetical protein WCV85_04440 [Patescibacteria group bacterium]|jgi:hypothetical protein
MADTDVRKKEHPVLNIAPGKDTVTIQCTDGREFELSVGQCSNMVSIHTTNENERVVEEGSRCTFHLTYDTTKLLSAWANEWPG